jgi:hypothetical protein
MSTTATTTELADQARHLATEAADLHRRLHRTYGTQGPTDASAAWLALDRLASELAAHPDPTPSVVTSPHMVGGSFRPRNDTRTGKCKSSNVPTRTISRSDPSGKCKR